MSDPESEGIGTLAGKMAKVMGAIDHVPKNGYNDYHKYEYSSDDDVMQSLRPVMAEHNLAVFHSIIDRDVKKVETSNGTSWKTVVTMEITIADADSGQSKTITWMGEADDGQDKGLYKALTSGVKYFALKTFLLSADTDVETHDAAASQGRPKSSGTKDPTDDQLEFAEDLADKSVWSEGESNRLHDRIDEASRSELSDLIDEMQEAIDDRENGGRQPQGNGQPTENASDLVTAVNNEVPSKLRSLAMQAGQAMPDSEVDAFVALLKSKEMPHLADAIEEHHEEYC